MKKFKNLLALTLTVLIAAMAVVPAFAETYFETDHFKFLRNEDLSVTIAGYDNSSESLVIPSTLINHEVVAIADVAFYENQTITSAVLPDTLVSIGNSAFYLAQNLTSVNIPLNCTALGISVFQNCSALKDVNIESNLTLINNQMFYSCTSLEEITLPDSVEAINAYAFGACSALERIYIPADTSSIAANAFKDTPNVRIYGYRNSYANTYADENSITFVALDDIDRTALSKALSAANEILGVKDSPYTSDSLAALKSVAAEALEVYNSKFSSQAEINKAASDLENAIDSLIFDYEEQLYGDVDLDGVITVDDVTDIQCYLANYFSFTPLQLTLGDVNEDGVTDITDATLIQCYLAMYDSANVGKPIPT